MNRPAPRPATCTVTTYDGCGNIKPTSPEVQAAWDALVAEPAFAAETSPGHIGPAPRRRLTAREKRAELATAALAGVGR